VTHDLDEALFLGDRIVLLSQGRLVAHLTPAEFLQSRNSEVQAYVRAFHRGETTIAAEKGA
jgi:osmoprotectant transport system ATP-binding protein